MKNFFVFFDFISHSKLQKWTPILYPESSGSIRGLLELSGKPPIGLSYLKCVFDSVF